jgi:aminopeptidase N
MPPAEETIDPTKRLKTVRFETTPIMSTYLLAFVIGELDYVEGVTSRDVKMRVYTPKEKSTLGKFALDVGIKVLTYFEDYFGIRYPLPKQDMVAIPDFSAGAMENWGLITFREVTLLCDANSSILTRFRVAYVVAHELAHQWFGNLVTMEWWKELWLNEGFATFAGNQAVDHLFPMWDVWTRFVSAYTFSALQKDALKSSHPIEVEIKHSRDVDEIFDAISYNKGAAVIRMIADFLTEPVFKKGLNIYLNRHKYRNATTVDLWKALSDASGISVIDIMDKWTQTVGYPVVSVREGGKDGTFLVSQKRFLSAGPNISEADDKTIWWVNLAIRAPTLTTPKFVTMKEKETIIDVPELRGAEWVKFNSGQSGVYRVQYSTTLLNKLVPAIASNFLDAVDRLGIQNDAFALAHSGHISLSEALSLALSYENESNYTVWSDLTDNLNTVLSIWAQEPVYPLLQKYMIKLYRKIGERVGWESNPKEDDLTKLLRSDVLLVLGTHGDQSVIAEARRRFAKYLQQPNTLNPNLRETVFKLVMRNGDENDYKVMQSLYEKPDNTPEEKIRTLRCLGYSSNPKLLSQYLDYALKSGKVREQDFYICVNVAFSCPDGRDLTWNFIKTHWEVISQRFAGQIMLLSRFISPASNFTSEEKAKECERFFENKNIVGMERTLKQTVETIRSRAAFLRRARDDVRTFLEHLFN